MDIRVLFLLILLCGYALWLMRRAGLFYSRRATALALVLLFCAFYLRALCLDYKTLDYIDFLSRWVDFFRSNGGFAALRYPIGNYNIPYLYFLALFSYSGVDDLYLIKLLSIFFDVLLAYASCQLLSKISDNRSSRLACFFTVLFLPTVVLNGALWAQCDVVFTALAILSIYQALDGRPVESMISITLSFGFKLQAVFVMPILAVLWMKNEYRFRHFFIFPAGYVLLVLPAVLLGRPFLDTITLYLNQTGSIGSGLNYNSSSVFALFTNVADEPLASKLGILAAFTAMLIILLVCFINRRRLTAKSVLAAAALFAVVIPFLLPHMHDRYFFAADILTVILAFAFPMLFPAPILTQFASLLGYHAYLKMRYLLPMRCGAVALLAVIPMAALCLYDSFSPAENRGKNKK